MTDRTLYDAGWDDSVQFGIDKKQLRESRAGFGMLLQLLGMIAGVLAVSIPFTMWIGNQTIYNYAPLIWIGAVAVCVGVGGFLLDKKDQVRYKQRESEFYQKWIARWDELGFNGDE